MLKFKKKMLKKKLENRQILEGDYPPRLQHWGGGHVPRVPPRGAAYACDEAKAEAGVKVADGGEKTKTQRKLYSCVSA